MEEDIQLELSVSCQVVDNLLGVISIARPAIYEKVIHLRLVPQVNKELSLEVVLSLSKSRHHSWLQRSWPFKNSRLLLASPL